MNESIKFLNSIELTKTDFVIVGCSGGPDSMCLLDILYKNGYNVVCAHVNHKIRKESDDEYIFIEKFCKERNIPFEGLELEPYCGQNESYYRKKRYNFYKDLADKYETKFIMTAHHADDLIETVLMRISRGSHLKGYMGFPKIYDEGKYKIIKPLIFYTKQEINQYNETNGIPSVHDSTNDEDKYTRNRYRHHLLPFLKEENPLVHKKFLKYNETLEEAVDFIDKSVKRALAKNYANKTLNASLFENEDPYIQKKEIEYILKDIYGNDIDKIRDKHLSEILKLIRKGKNFSLNLPDAIEVVREYDKIRFKKKKDVHDNYKIELTDKTILPNDDEIHIVTSSQDTTNWTIRLNSNSICLPIYIRNKRPGDKICIKNMVNSKKVSDIFIDCKVPKSERDAFPVVTDKNDDIIWLPGLKKSKFDVNIDGKYDIILEYIKRKESNK